MALDRTGYEDGDDNTLDTISVSDITDNIINAFVGPEEDYPASTWSPSGKVGGRYVSEDETETQWYGIAYNVNLLIYIQTPYSGEPGASTTLERTFTFTSRMWESTSVGAPLLFEQAVTVTLTLNSYLETSGTWNLSYSYSESISTTVIDGETVATGDAVNYLDNGNLSEYGDNNISFTPGTSTAVGGMFDPPATRSSGIWQKLFKSAPYVMEFGSGAKWETVFTVDSAYTNLSNPSLQWENDVHLSPERIHMFPVGNRNYYSRPAHLFGTAEDKSGSQFGMFIDRTGTLYSAVNDGTDVQVSRFPNGAASRELLAVIPSAKTPSYNLAENGNAHLLSYTDRNDGAIKLVKSRDAGRSFT